MYWLNIYLNNSNLDTTRIVVALLDPSSKVITLSFISYFIVFISFTFIWDTVG